MALGIFSGFSASASGLSAERIRMQTIAENIANINTTRQEGTKEPYRRKEVLFEEILCGREKGAVRASIELDDTPAIRLYDPKHPDADENGYVRKPNIDIHFEMADLLSASRAYQANLVAMKLYKDMVQRTIAMGS